MSTYMLLTTIWSAGSAFAIDGPEGPRPSTHKVCGCGQLRPFGHYFCRTCSASRGVR